MNAAEPYRFEFATATRIIFGLGTLREVGPIAKMAGRRALVVTGRTPERAQPLLAALSEQGISFAALPVPGEPTTDAVTAGVQRAKTENCDFVVSFGGGSAVDAGKAIAALLTNAGNLLDFLEVIGNAKPLVRRSAPFIAIPTTAGAGAEVTRNAVLASPAHRVKASLRSPLLQPWAALVDPELTRDLPRTITASTGLDALTQLIEPYVSCRANPLTDGICLEGMRRAARSLLRACENGHDGAARSDMSLASLFSGLALANAGLGAVHGFAAPLGGRFTAPHGAVCAALLPHVMEANVGALQRRSPESEVLRRYQEIARLLTGRPQAAIEDGIDWVRELCRELQIPSLRTYGVTLKDLPDLVEKASQASSMKANPIALAPEEMHGLLAHAL